MSDLLEPRAMGRAPARRDGPRKVRGEAVYAFETEVENPAYAQIVTARVARGRIAHVDATAARTHGGVLAILTHENAERLASDADAELAVLQSAEVAFRGQAVALIIAESSEVAREAARTLEIDYDEQAHDSALSADRSDLYAPDKVNPSFDTDVIQGDVAAAVQSSAVTLDETYRTAMYHNNPLEPHASTALWDPTAAVPLTLWDSTQGVHPARSAVAETFGLEEEQIRMICPFVGGGFGSKGTPHANVILAALAARALPGRPVKLALTRQQMFSLAGYRTPTIQRMRLAADPAGHLAAVAIDVVEQTSRIKEFAEQTGLPVRMMYAAPNRSSTHRLAALDVPVPSWMRAPGECPGMFGPEVAMDELADRLGIDPIELRIRNEPTVDPETGQPWSSRHLVECLRQGAARFGWDQRDPRPAGRRYGNWLIGAGVAASVYPTQRMAQSTARIRFDGDRYIAEIGAADLGTGAWTILPQILADALEVDLDEVDVEIGDTVYPTASVAGGSSGTNTWGSALVVAARAFRAQFGENPSAGSEATGDVDQAAQDDEHSTYAFGAQFAEARVNVDTGEIRVARLLGVFAAGRIINPRTARSQFIGGMTMGLSMALHETSVWDLSAGQVVNHDLGEYHIATHADVQSIEAHWLDEHDPYVNAMGSKGIGEIGIVGTAAAVANAVHNATGVRIRELPITLDKLLPALPGAGLRNPR